VHAGRQHSRPARCSLTPDGADPGHPTRQQGGTGMASGNSSKPLGSPSASLNGKRAAPAPSVQWSVCTSQQRAKPAAALTSSSCESPVIAHRTCARPSIQLPLISTWHDTPPSKYRTQRDHTSTRGHDFSPLQTNTPTAIPAYHPVHSFSKVTSTRRMRQIQVCCTRLPYLRVLSANRQSVGPWPSCSHSVWLGRQGKHLRCRACAAVGCSN
jgi:hypothetical protein